MMFKYFIMVFHITAIQLFYCNICMLRTGVKKKYYVKDHSNENWFKIMVIPIGGGGAQYIKY